VISPETYYPYSRYLEEVFGAKTYKVVVASGLTCPTRDGKIGKGGCAFCDVRGSGSYFGKQNRSAKVSEQLAIRLPAVKKRFGARKFLAYFQSYTNTYSDVPYLESIYREALDNPDICGLCVGTRPDCLPDEVLTLLQKLAETHYISLELGVQSFENETLEWLNRGHDRQSSIDALTRLRDRAPNVHVCAHLIFGSPTDSPGAARDAALLLGDLGVRGTKLHQLMVLEHTELARRWKENRFPTLSIEEYSDKVAEFLEYLPASVYMERLCATASHSEECLAPEWSRNRWEPHNRIREILLEKGCEQGRKREFKAVSDGSSSPADLRA
jgi:radical SAM protein (TIGR01212 family)